MTADTLIFLLIVGAIFISFLWAIFIIIFKIIKAIKRVLAKRVKLKEKINFTGIKVEPQQESPIVPKTRIMGGDFVKVSKKTAVVEKNGKQLKKDYSSGLSGLKNRKAEPENTNVLKGGFIKSGRISLKK